MGTPACLFLYTETGRSAHPTILTTDNHPNRLSTHSHQLSCGRRTIGAPELARQLKSPAPGSLKLETNVAALARVPDRGELASEF